MLISANFLSMNCDILRIIKMHQKWITNKFKLERFNHAEVISNIHFLFILKRFIYFKKPQIIHRCLL